MHFTPTSGSWMNLVEVFFGIITRQAIRRATFTSVTDLQVATGTYIDAWNQRCEPFRWVKDADTILANATRPKPTNTQDASAARHYVRGQQHRSARLQVLGDLPCPRFRSAQGRRPRRPVRRYATVGRGHWARTVTVRPGSELACTTAAAFGVGNNAGDVRGAPVAGEQSRVDRTW
ncbi:MAG: hypothetical protein HHJ13_15110 [Phycicoccus sp.]|nr:hypothetical protein [Phycicoccus sp.]